MQILKRTLSALLVVVMIVALFPAVAFAEAKTLEEFAQDQLLQTVDFSKYEDSFTNLVTPDDPVTNVFSYDKVEGDNNALHVHGDSTKNVAGTASGFDLVDADGNTYTADSSTYYTMTYKIWMETDVSAQKADGVYVGVGGVKNSSSVYLAFSTNATVNGGSGAFRGGSKWTGKTAGVDATPDTAFDYDTKTLATGIEEYGEKAFHTIRVTYDGPNKRAIAYVLKAGESGVHADDWVQWQSATYTPGSGSLKFSLTTYDPGLDCIIRDVNYYKGDIVCSGEKTEEITKEATCVEDGVKTYTCACGETTTEVIPATGVHNYIDGKCTVCQEDEPVLDPVASVNGENYGSLEAAIAAATEKDTIKLLKDQTVSATIEIDKNVTITADGVVTVTVADDIDNMFKLTSGKLTVAGKSEDAKITLAAGKNCKAIILGNGGNCDISNTVLAGDTETSIVRGSAHGFSSDAAAGTYTFTNVDIRDVYGDGIRAAKTGQTVNLDNVTIDNTGRFGIYAIATVNIYNNQHADKALMISNTYEHCIDIKDKGTVISHLKDVDEGVYPIQLDTTIKSSARGILVRADATLNITNVSIKNTQHSGLDFLTASSSGSVSDFEIVNAGVGGSKDCYASVYVVGKATLTNGNISQIPDALPGIMSVADSSLTVSNVAVNNCSESTANIQGTLNGTISFPDHKYVAGETVAPTCTEVGYTPYTCSVCGDSYKSDELPAAEHSFNEGEVTTAATCEADGVMTYTCTREGCGYSYTDAIDALGHSYGANNICSNCGEKNPNACEHSYTYECDKVCALCDEVTRPDADHSYDDECDVDCNYCGVERDAPTAVAAIGDVNYGSLESAVAAANETEEADVITVLDDLEISSQLVITTDMTITADKAVTITASENWTGSSGMIRLNSGKLTLAGAKENAKITLAAGTKTTNIIVGMGGDADITNVHLKGNESPAFNLTDSSYNTYGINIESDTNTETTGPSKITLTNVDITDQMDGDGIRGAYTGSVVNLNNVTINNTGRYGIKATRITVNINNSLSISNTGEHGIDIDAGGKVISNFDNVPDDSYLITIDTTTKSNGRGIIVRAGGELDITNVSIKNVKHSGVDFLTATSSGSVSNFEIVNAGFGGRSDCYASVYVAGKATLINGNISQIPDALPGIMTVDGSSLSASDVAVNTCVVSIAEGTLTEDSKIAYAEHSYDNGVCSVCGDVLASITLSSATLNLQDKVSTIYNATEVLAEDVTVAEHGVLLYNSEEKAASKDPKQAYETIVLDESYAAQSEGIDARDMDKSQFAVAYVKLTDGSYIFGTKDGEDQIVEYSPLIYCEKAMADENTSAEVKNVCVAMMHYGAAAQKVQYGMTSGLMNEGFEAPEGVAYSESMLGETVFSANTRTINGMKLRSVTMALKGAISYIVKYSAEGVPTGKTLHAEYTLLDKTVTVEMIYDENSGLWVATLEGIAPKDLSATLTVKPYYVGDDGKNVYGGELVFSGYEYTRIVTKNASYTDEVKDLAKALAMYVSYADAYAKLVENQ